MNLTKDLTILYIKYHRSKKCPADILANIQEALILAQSELSDSEKITYTKWHQKKWPNLDW